MPGSWIANCPIEGPVSKLQMDARPVNRSRRHRLCANHNATGRRDGRPVGHELRLDVNSGESINDNLSPDAMEQQGLLTVIRRIGRRSTAPYHGSQARSRSDALDFHLGFAGVLDQRGT